MRYIHHPEIATVGQSGRAYFQRIVAIGLALFCVCSEFYMEFTECRLFEILAPGVGLGKDASFAKNFSIAVGGIYDAFGVAVDSENPVIDSILNEEGFSWDDYDAIYFSAVSFAWIEHDENTFWNRTYDCKYWREEPFTNQLGLMHGWEVEYMWTIKVLMYITPWLGIAGIVCASVELFFVAFYPSVIAGAIFLASAAFTEIIWMTMFIAKLRQCFTEDRCQINSNTFLYIETIFAYLFASMLLMFGLRTYPWCRRRNRNPNHCKDVDPEIVSKEDMDAVWNANANSNAGDSGDEDVPWEAFTKLKTMLQETNEKLVRTKQELAEAVAEATRAEDQLRAYTNNNNNNNIAENGIATANGENDNDNANNIAIAIAKTNDNDTDSVASVGDPLERDVRMEVCASELEIVSECRRAMTHALQTETKRQQTRRQTTPP